MERIIIGEVLKPQGIRGEIKIKPKLDTVELYKKFSCVLIDQIEYEIENISIRDGFVFLKLKGITSCLQVEKMRGKFVELSKDTVESTLSQDEYLVADVLGLMLVDENNKSIGKLEEINNYGSADVYSVKLEKGGYMLFPNVSNVIIKVDIANKKILVDSKRLSEVAVYEN